MLGFFKVLLRGIICTILLPLILLVWVLYGVYCLITFVVVFVKNVILFFAGDSASGDMKEDLEAKRILLEREQAQADTAQMMNTMFQNTVAQMQQQQMMQQNIVQMQQQMMQQNYSQQPAYQQQFQQQAPAEQQIPVQQPNVNENNNEVKESDNNDGQSY